MKKQALEKARKFADAQKRRIEEEARRIQAIADEADRQERIKQQKLADELLAKMLEDE